MKIFRIISNSLLILSILVFACCSRGKAKYSFAFQENLSIGLDEGDENYIFAQISDICADDERNIYVLDSKKTEVFKYDENGLFKLSFGQEGQGPGQFENPRAIATHKDKIYILDFFKIIVFRNDGTFLSSFPIDFQGIDIAFDDKGQLVVSGPGKQNIFHVYDNARLVGSYGEFFEVPERFSQFKEARLFRVPLKIYICGRHTYVMNPYEYEIVIWENGVRQKSLKRKEPEFLAAEIKSERGGFSGIVGSYFIQEQDDRLYVFYSRKGQKYGLDVWVKGRCVASFEVKNIPVDVDKYGKFYVIDMANFPRVVRCEIEIQQK
jgi:hypothetical protein